jgi:hypothetical protein
MRAVYWCKSRPTAKGYFIFKNIIVEAFTSFQLSSMQAIPQVALQSETIEA